MRSYPAPRLTAPQPQSLPDYNAHLPADRQWFRVTEVAKICHLSLQHVVDLVRDGRFTFDQLGPVNFSGDPSRTRATTRLPRACIVAFLQANRQQ